MAITIVAGDITVPQRNGNLDLVPPDGDAGDVLIGMVLTTPDGNIGFRTYADAGWVIEDSNATSSSAQRVTLLGKISSGPGSNQTAGLAYNGGFGTSLSGGLARAYRLSVPPESSFADTEYWTAIDNYPNDTDVLATTGTIPAGSFIPDDVVFITASVSYDTVTHLSQSVSIPGCTLSPISWNLQTSDKNNGRMGMYVGIAHITSGISTAGSISYTATPDYARYSSSAVGFIRVRENPPPATMTKVWNGSSWVTGVFKMYGNGEWNPTILKHYDGGSWNNL